MRTDEAADIEKLVAQAEKMASRLEDSDLRKIAFDRVLESLLRRAPEIVDSPRRRNVASPSLVERSGPMGWLMELVEGNFFDTLRPTREIVSALEEKGHFLKPEGLTRQLTMLLDRRILRRTSMTPEGESRDIWHYSNW